MTVRKSDPPELGAHMSGDTIEGAREIALFLWGDASPRRRVYYYLETPGRIPVSRDPWTGRLRATRRDLLTWRAAIEAERSLRVSSD